MAGVSSGENDIVSGGGNQEAPSILDFEIGLFQVNAAGEFVFINKRSCELFELSQKQTQGISLFGLVHNSGKIGLQQEWETESHKDGGFISGFKVKKHDGGLKWIQCYVRPWQNGFSVAIIGESDNTENFSGDDKLYQKVKESQRMLAEAQRLAHIGSWEWDTVENTITWSEELYKIFGVEYGTEITLESYYDAVHPEDRIFVKNSILDAYKTKSNFKFQHRILIDGEDVFVLCRGETILDKEDNPIMVRGTATDITDRQKAEEEILNKKMATISFQSALLNLSRSPFNNIKESFENITRKAAKEIGVERVGIWLFNGDREQIACHCLYELSTGKHGNKKVLSEVDFPNYFNALKENRVLNIFDANKDIISIELSENYLKPLGISSMLDVPIRSHGRLLGVICFEHKGEKREWSLEEQSFASSISDIAALAIEANNTKMAEKELYLLNEKLTVINEHKDKFISVISHDLRSPISSIISSSGLLLNHGNDIGPEDEERMLKVINRASKDILYQLEELVKIAKLKNYTSLYFPEKILLAKEVEEDVRLVKQVAGEKEIRILNNIESDVYIYADRIMLKSILQNLLVNAIKFSYKGSLIKIYTKDFSEDMIEITIADYGMGMDFEKSKELFNESYYSGSELGTEGETGTGLGLRIVKDFVEQHKGEIWVNSFLGKGTEISFTMPIRKAD